MKARHLLPLLFALAAACSADEAASDNSKDFQCEKDSDCGSGNRCDAAGNCRCLSDSGCGEDEFCNQQSYCQERPPCLSNADCSKCRNGLCSQTTQACASDADCAGRFLCNAAGAGVGGACIPVTQCGANVHCPIGQRCSVNAETQQGFCVPGCDTSDDCQLGQVCKLVSGTRQCTAGDCSVCPTFPDIDASYCDYGDTCSPSTGACTPHATKANVCQSCSVGSQSSPPVRCPTGMVCLFDAEGDGSQSYCSPLCEVVDECPSGFGQGCRGLILVSEDCTTDAACSRHNDGAICIGSAESATGFCSCVDDTDCKPQGLCMDFFLGKACVTDGSSCNTDADCKLCVNGQCANYLASCVTEEDCLTTCVTREDNGVVYGNCETNLRGCIKSEGLTCDTVRNGTPFCQQ